MQTASNPPFILEGKKLFIAAIVLAIANFVVVLDMTIANVSISHIAGSLAISMSEGTYVITSYAVAEAISVPLTGWIASRFGAVRVFIICFILFGLFSALCGCATNLPMLVIGRILQGLAGGPLMPLTQTLLTQIFPENKKTNALAIWSMTTLLAPIIGPIVGGYICDNWSWHFIFYINIPIVAVCSIANLRLLKGFETQIFKKKIDFIGLSMLIVWVSALQIMLDEGKNYDWFQSTEIWVLAIIALIGFVSFVIWEITHDNPIVNLKVFRHKGYTASVITLSLTFGAYFSSIVLTPLWLQNFMDYTATWSGCTTAATGIFAVLVAPFAAKLSTKCDPRLLVCCGIGWICLVTFIRSFASTDLSYESIALPLLLQGLGTPFFFVPLTALAMASVSSDELASAAGLMSFLRTLSSAISTSIVTTAWENQANVVRTDLAPRMSYIDEISSLFPQAKPDSPLSSGLLDNLLHSQAIMMSMNHIFLITSIILCIAAILVWFAPKPTGAISIRSDH